MDLARDPEDVIGLEDKVRFLNDPGAYPDEGPARVESIETHISWVFLTGQYAYKLKKPVCFDYLDFTRLDARERDCRDELRLNRRLAHDIYLDVVPLMWLSGGGLQLGGHGTVLDWLVKMRRLPASVMLDAAIAAGNVDTRALERVVALLVSFYRHQPPEPLVPEAYLRALAAEVRDNAAVLARPRYGLPVERIEQITRQQLACLDRYPLLFLRRVRQGRVVEAHGDLRPQHVCLSDPPVIIDCLEFKRELRVLDGADELAYLALECERLGAPALGRFILDRYASLSGDAPSLRLREFYMSHRALVRAKIAAWHTDDKAVNDHDGWTRRALDYLDLAENHARCCSEALE
jgi:aminoglycoside phosphotransferase family enzyme